MAIGIYLYHTQSTKIPSTSPQQFSGKYTTITQLLTPNCLAISRPSSSCTTRWWTRSTLLATSNAGKAVLDNQSTTEFRIEVR